MDRVNFIGMDPRIGVGSPTLTELFVCGWEKQKTLTGMIASEGNQDVDEERHLVGKKETNISFYISSCDISDF